MGTPVKSVLKTSDKVPRTGSSPLKVDDEGPRALQDDFLHRLAGAGVASGADMACPGGTPVTMEALGKLLKQELRPIQVDIEAIKAHGVSQKDAQDAVGPLKTAVGEITKMVEALETNPSRPTSARSVSATSARSVGI